MPDNNCQGVYRCDFTMEGIGHIASHQNFDTAGRILSLFNMAWIRAVRFAGAELKPRTILSPQRIPEFGSGQDKTLCRSGS